MRHADTHEEAEGVAELKASEDAKAEHARLGREIAEHDKRYHQDDAPIVSDADYDALRRRYEALERAHPDLATADSLTRKVGAAPSEKFAKVRHDVPMLSLGNIFAEDEVGEFVARVTRFLGLAEAAGLHRRAEDRRALLLAALRERRAGAGGDARRRLRGRGRHRQCPHDRRDSAEAEGRAAFPMCWKCAAKSTCATPISPR